MASRLARTLTFAVCSLVLLAGGGTAANAAPVSQAAAATSVSQTLAAPTLNYGDTRWVRTGKTGKWLFWKTCEEKEQVYMYSTRRWADTGWTKNVFC